MIVRLDPILSKGRCSLPFAFVCFVFGFFFFLLVQCSITFKIIILSFKDGLAKSWRINLRACPKTFSTNIFDLINFF